MPASNCGQLGRGPRDYSHALWEAVAWARQAGIEDRQLDGGYVINGWLQYAHPEHATRGPNGDAQVPGVNGGEALRYGIVIAGWFVAHGKRTPWGLRAPRGDIPAHHRPLGPHFVRL